MKEIKNGKIRSGRKVYRVMAKQDRDNHKPENCKLVYNTGRHAADNGELDTWQVNSLNTERQLYKSFSEAAHAFEQRTEQKPPTPNFEVTN